MIGFMFHNKFNKYFDKDKYLLQLTNVIKFLGDHLLIMDWAGNYGRGEGGVILGSIMVLHLSVIVNIDIFQN